jgi:hypothetical protein
LLAEADIGRYNVVSRLTGSVPDGPVRTVIR